MIPIPCPHFNLVVISRAKDQSAVEKAAYQSGQDLYCEREGKIKKTEREDRVQLTEILLPSHVPKKYADREMDCYNKTRHPPTRKGIIKKNKEGEA